MVQSVWNLKSFTWWSIFFFLKWKVFVLDWEPSIVARFVQARTDSIDLPVIDVMCNCTSWCFECNAFRLTETGERRTMDDSHGKVNAGKRKMNTVYLRVFMALQNGAANSFTNRYWMLFEMGSHSDHRNGIERIKFKSWNSSSVNWMCEIFSPIDCQRKGKQF